MEEEMEEELTCEQEYLLRAVAQDAMEMNKEELILALLSCWEARFRQKQVFLSTCRSAGYVFKLDEGAGFTPESLEDLEKIFGYAPSEEELRDYYKSLHETVTMSVDMNEIVLEKDY